MSGTLGSSWFRAAGLACLAAGLAGCSQGPVEAPARRNRPNSCEEIAHAVLLSQPHETGRAYATDVDVQRNSLSATWHEPDGTTRPLAIRYEQIAAVRAQLDPANASARGVRVTLSDGSDLLIPVSTSDRDARNLEQALAGLREDREAAPAAADPSMELAACTLCSRCH